MRLGDANCSAGCAGDLVGRWGGEEFVILANGGDERTMGDLAERFRALVASVTVGVGGVDIPIRLSVGAALAVAADEPQDVFTRADTAHYEAKEGGRSRRGSQGH